jgi:phosphoenolpyruvate phosphomutase
MTKAEQFRSLLGSGSLDFLCEAHNGLSARIAEEAGFKGLWASGLTMSAALGVRDSNEASWTQILEILEFMSDATKIPILVDADTGYGNFNNVRRLVQKLENRGVAAVCIEDKKFPKTNSLLEGGRQELAEIDEFCGRIRAAKDAQEDPNFCVVARTESFIAGHGLKEAIKRAEAYRKAGADAILIHSKSIRADEILSFKKEWGSRLPVVIVPTTYYATPTEVFREAGFSMVIWANMILRSSIQAMKDAAAHLASQQSLHALDDKIAPVSEVFRLQGADELSRAEKKYLPSTGEHARALILAASRGIEFGKLTEQRPKAMLEVGGKPLLYKHIETLEEIGIHDFTVVRGYKKNVINTSGVRYVDNDNYAKTKEVTSLKVGIDALPTKDCKTLVAYGDLLYKKFIASILLEAEGDIVMAVDPNWKESIQKGRYMDYVETSEPYHKRLFDSPVDINDFGPEIDKHKITGEWFGLMVLSPKGFDTVKDVLNKITDDDLRMTGLIKELLKRGHTIKAFFVNGYWLDVDDVKDFAQAGTF